MHLTDRDKSDGTVRVALAGNPNAGKTSIFNGLTGARRKVANYPGVTVEKREGVYQVNGTRYEVLDLPGTYSLSAYSPEERIAEHELLHGKPDVTVVVCDSTTLNRGLVLLAQVMQTGANPVLCLNMADEAREAGQDLDVDGLRRLLGIPVVQTVGRTGEGLDDLKRVVSEAVERPVEKARLVLGERMDRAVDAVSGAMREFWDDPGTLDWAATRLLLGHGETLRKVEAVAEKGNIAVGVASRWRDRIEAETGTDIQVFISERWFGYVDGLLKEVTRRQGRADARAVSDRIDSVLAHRLLGLPFFLAVMYGVFWLTFTVGEAPMGWIDSGFEVIGALIASLWPAGSESAVKSLLVDGVIAGVGGVIVFLPNIILLFLGLAVLEDTGYMARAAFLVDRFMRRFGLHGKSFIPMMTGFGCSIPGIMGTRVLENERDRLTTMLVLPLISCGARLPIWMLLIPAFFAPPWRAPVLWFIYVFGVALALVLALLLRSTLLKGDDAPFVMELPPYRLPTLRGLVTKMTERSWLYVRKAGTVILGISIVLWFLTSYPKPGSYRVDEQAKAGLVDEQEAESARASEDLRHSIAGRIGSAIEPILAPLGFDWKLGTAMIGAFAAKEVFVSQMGIVHSLGETSEESVPLRESLSREYSPLVGLSLMLFLLVSAPCMATIAVTRRESGRWKWALLQLGGLTAVAWMISFSVYQIGSLLT
ncbi:MAG: ferrous iron transport protein B [Deltaproteobacteria bacterium]|nr:ferrous iron transport protein B [Deltaproteobacteria bacterium]